MINLPLPSYFPALAWLVLLWLLTLPANGQHEAYFRLGEAQGLPSANVYEMIQDREGNLWLATAEGVTRYDGYRFRNFTTRDGLLNNDVWHLHEDAQGRIWIFSFTSELVYAAGDRIHRIRPPFDLLEYELRGVTEGSDGALWFSCANGIFRLQDSTFTLWDPSNSPFEGWTVYLETDPNGNLWFFNDNTIYRDSSGHFSAYPMGQKRTELVLPWPVVKSGANPEVLLLTTQYLVRFSRADHSFTSQSWKDLLGVDAQLIKFLGHNPSSGYFWLQTDHGLFVLDQNFRPRPWFDQFKDFQFSHTFRDREQNIWLPSYGKGIFFIPSGAEHQGIVHYRLKEGWNTQRPMALATGPNNRLFVGTESGVLLLSDDQELQPTGLDFKERIADMVSDTVNHVLLIGSYRGLAVVDLKNSPENIDQTGISRAYGEPTPPDTYVVEHGNEAVRYHSMNVKHLRAAPQRGVIGVSSYNGFYLVDYRNPKRSKVTRLTEERTYASAFSDSHTIWLGHTNGLSCWKKGVHHTTGKGLEHIRMSILDLLADSTGKLWIATNGHGLIRFDPQNGDTVHLPELRHDVVRQLATDDEGGIWAATNQGLKRIRVKSDAPFRYDYQVVGRKDGLSSDAINRITVAGNRVFQSSNSGVTQMKTVPPNRNPNPPPVTIKSITVNRQARDVSSLRQLSYRENDLSFAIVGFSYRSMGDIRYRYQLEGWDKTWSTTIYPEVTYPNLSPGTYRFRVVAVDSEGNTSPEPAEVEITILPHWSQTTWFRVLLIGSGLSLILILALLRIRQVRLEEQRKATIERQVSRLKVQAIQARMDPHFIFNALNAIQHYMRNRDPELVNEYLARFAGLIRMSLEISQQSTIPLALELDYLDHYLWLEKLRLGEKMDYHIHQEPELARARLTVPGMLIQPLAENAVVHGILPSGRAGKVDILIRQQGRELVIVVDDNGIGLEASKNRRAQGHTSRGLQLIRERLELLYPGHTGAPLLQLSTRNDAVGQPCGTRAALRLPLPDPSH